MLSMPRLGRVAFVTAWAVVLTACAPQKEPAQQLIKDIEVAVTAASAEASTYVPDQLMDVQIKLGELKAAFAKEDYAAVVTGGPAVLFAAQSLATAAAARKDAMLQSLNDDWTNLAAELPDEVAAIQSRLEFLTKKSSRKLAQGIDLEQAKSSASAAASLWSKAQAAFAAGNLMEAVPTAKDVKSKLDAVAMTLKLPPAPAPAA
jgi:hypothetical protein